MRAREIIMRTLRIKGLGPMIVLAAGFPAGGALSGEVAADSSELVRARLAMGTVLTIRVPDPGPGATEAVERAFDRVARLEDALTTWRPDGELFLVNARLAAEGPGRLSLGRDLGRALAAALDWWRRTDGLFDPALGTLLDAWRVERPSLPGPPPDLDTARRAAGAAGIRVLAEPRGGWRLVVPRADVRFDLGGIGKGWALDEAAQVLEAAGIGSALLDFGGQLLVLGETPARIAWPVAIADPRNRDRPALLLTLQAGSVATSSNAVRHRIEDGRLVGHVLDPRSGLPTSGRASFTVLAGTATAADALATALAAGGPEAAGIVERSGADWLVLSPDEVCGLRWRASERLARLADLLRGITSEADNGGCVHASAFDVPGVASGEGAGR